MDASQAIAFVEQNYPQYPQQQKYIIAQYVMQRASALKQQQAQQQLAEDSGGGSVAGGVAGAVLPTAAAYGIEALLASPAVSTPQIISALSAPAGTFAASGGGAAAASGGGVVLGGGAGATSTTALAAGGQLGGGAGAGAATGGSTAGATGMTASSVASVALPLLAAAYAYKLSEGRADRIYDRTDDSLLASETLNRQLPGFSEMPREKQLEVLGKLRESGLLSKADLKTKRESESTRTDYSKAGYGNQPDIFTGYAPKAARNSDYDRDKEQYRVYDDLRKSGTIYDILEKGNLGKQSREKMQDFVNYYGSIQGQAPTMTPYQPPANLQALTNSPGNRVGYQQQLQPYYAGAPAGNYRAPDGVNTVTVGSNGETAYTRIGVLSPEQQQTAWGAVQPTIGAPNPQNTGSSVNQVVNQAYGIPASPAQQTAWGAQQQPPKVMNYQEYLNSRQPNYWEDKAQNMSAPAKSLYGMLQSTGGQKSLNQTDYLNYAAGQMQGGLALANQPQSAPVPPGGVGGPGYKPDPNRPGHFIRR
jgi:hypothetical protein